MENDLWNWWRKMNFVTDHGKWHWNWWRKNCLLKNHGKMTFENNHGKWTFENDQQKYFLKIVEITWWKVTFVNNHEEWPLEMNNQKNYLGKNTSVKYHGKLHLKMTLMIMANDLRKWSWKITIESEIEKWPLLMMMKNYLWKNDCWNELTDLSSLPLSLRTSPPRTSSSWWTWTRTSSPGSATSTRNSFSMSKVSPLTSPVSI